METNVNYTIVGLFVIILVSFTVLGIIWLSSGLSTGEYNTFKVYMKESVGGLNIDSSVEFNGVNVGTVKKVEIDQHDPRLVVVLLSVKNTTPITNATKATLNTKGLTGIAYIALEDQGDDITPVHEIPGEEFPIINTAPSFFWRLDTGMRKLSENLSKVTHSIELLLNEDNLQSIKEILIDMRHVTRTLATNTGEIDSILHNTAKASEQFTPLLQSSLNAMRTLSTQILPAANDAMINLNMLTHNLSAVSIEIKENPAVLIRGKNKQALGPGEK